MTRLVIAVCSYERVDGLKRTLEALENQRLASLDPSQVVLTVIDNSETASAQAMVAAFQAQSRFEVLFIHEKRKGLAHARNAALDTAATQEATHLAFVDDDELPEPGWLEALLKGLMDAKAGAALGPVYPVFSSCPKSHLPLAAYATKPPLKNGFATEGYTGNLMLDMGVVEAMSLRFDNRFNDIGGEDTLFFRAFQAAGHTIAWAPDAIIHETFAPNRMTAKWLWLRWYRTGSIEAQLGPHPAGSTKGRLASLKKGAVRIAAGGARTTLSALVSGWSKPDRTVASGYTLCRGAGLIANVFGRDYREYDKANYS